MILTGFLAFVALACTIALTDWRRAWLLAIVVGILQDPIRKLTPGMPVYITFSIIGVYMAILFAVHHRVQIAGQDFSRRFPAIWSAFGLTLLFLFLAAVNGVMNYGVLLWKVPLLSLFTYVAPLPAILLGYMYLDDEERLFGVFRFYAVCTSIALLGTPLEYYRIHAPALGMVQQVGDYIRYLPGIEVRMISGFYRAPDIMGWHAAMLTCISIAMLVRAEIGRRAWPWMLTSGWGFYNCILSGRRKAIYFVAVFAAAFLWRYFRRLKAAQIAAFVLAGMVIAFVAYRISSDEGSRAYTTAAIATSDEVTQRIEGGLLETIRQVGVLGAGLGKATQGVQHLLSQDQQLSWQEGGLGKLAIELGIPGLLAVALLAFATFRAATKISSVPDHRATSQIGRVTLFAIAIANIANFLASAQAYSDPVLTILTCFFAGCLFATATLDERTAQQPQPASELVPVTA